MNHCGVPLCGTDFDGCRDLRAMLFGSLRADLRRPISLPEGGFGRCRDWSACILHSSLFILHSKGAAEGLHLFHKEEPMKTYQGVLYDIDGTLLNTINMNLYPLIRIIKVEEMRKGKSIWKNMRSRSPLPVCRIRLCQQQVQRLQLRQSR